MVARKKNLSPVTSEINRVPHRTTSIFSPSFHFCLAVFRFLCSLCKNQSQIWCQILRVCLASSSMGRFSYDFDVCFVDVIFSVGCWCKPDAVQRWISGWPLPSAKCAFWIVVRRAFRVEIMIWHQHKFGAVFASATAKQPVNAEIIKKTVCWQRKWPEEAAQLLMAFFFVAAAFRFLPNFTEHRLAHECAAGNEEQRSRAHSIIRMLDGVHSNT